MKAWTLGLLFNQKSQQVLATPSKHMGSLGPSCALSRMSATGSKTHPWWTARSMACLRQKMQITCQPWPSLSSISTSVRVATLIWASALVCLAASRGMKAFVIALNTIFRASTRCLRPQGVLINSKIPRRQRSSMVSTRKLNCRLRTRWSSTTAPLTKTSIS